MTGRKRAKRAVVKKQRKIVILETLGQENIVNSEVTESGRGERQKLFHSDILRKAAGAIQKHMALTPFAVTATFHSLL